MTRILPKESSNHSSISIIYIQQRKIKPKLELSTILSERLIQMRLFSFFFYHFLTSLTFTTPELNSIVNELGPLISRGLLISYLS